MNFILIGEDVPSDTLILGHIVLLKTDDVWSLAVKALPVQGTDLAGNPKTLQLSPGQVITQVLACIEHQEAQGSVH